MALPPSLTDRKVELLPEQRRARKKMYRDRKMNMFKKAEELSILCGTDVAVVLYHPADESSTAAQPAVETWPKNPTEVKRIIRRYKATTASTLASFPSTSPLEIEDKSTTSTPSSSSPSSSSPSPSRRVPEKRTYMNLDLSLSGSYDSPTKMLKDDKGKKKLHDEDDHEKINSQEAGMEIQFKYPTLWDCAGRENLYDAKLALLEAKQKAIANRIASLEATRA